MKTLVFGIFVFASTAAPAFAAGLQLSIRDGRVTLDAQDVTVRQILTEWARVGRTRIVNAERISGGPVTLKLENVPEKQALDTVLRTVPGYMAVPRPSLVAEASIYDSILLMPTTVAVATAAPRPASVSGFPGSSPGGTLTQLRPAQPAPLSPGMLPEPAESAADQANDPAIAAAAAAGLVPVPAPSPNPAAISAPLMVPAGSQPATAQAPPPGTVAAPANPWNAPAGTATPTFTPPPPPPAMNAPLTRPRPPQADR
jgi:hypothetical protein